MRKIVDAQLKALFKTVGVDRKAPLVLTRAKVEFRGNLNSEPLSTSLVLSAPFRFARRKTPSQSQELSSRHKSPRNGAILVATFALLANDRLTRNRRTSLRRTQMMPPFLVRLKPVLPGLVQRAFKQLRMVVTLESLVSVCIRPVRVAPTLLQRAKIPTFKHPMTQP